MVYLAVIEYLFVLAFWCIDINEIFEVVKWLNFTLWRLSFFTLTFFDKFTDICYDKN